MEKTKIEWCDSSWNPVSGCYHNCPYCYARRIAMRYKGCDESPRGETGSRIVELKERLPVTRSNGKTINAAYPYGFTPTLHEYRLNDLKTKKFGTTIFVCSTADLFGDWIPDEWIKKVFDACKESSEHRYLFLTKNPARYIELQNKDLLPEGDNFWYGSTATGPDDPIFFSDKHNTFVSIEPILEPFVRCIPNSYFKYIDWIILGAETGNRTGKVVPEKEWLTEILDSVKEYGTPVFMKDSLKPIWGEDIITQYPWRENKV